MSHYSSLDTRYYFTALSLVTSPRYPAVSDAGFHYLESPNSFSSSFESETQP